jgi:hypothetical protein
MLLGAVLVQMLPLGNLVIPRDLYRYRVDSQDCEEHLHYLASVVSNLLRRVAQHMEGNTNQPILS